MHRALIATILAMIGVLLALVSVILGGRAWREWCERWRRRRRQVLEPLVLAFAHGSDESIVPALKPVASARDLPVLEEIILDFAQRLAGVERERLARAFDELGLTDRCLAALTAKHWHRRAEAAEKLGLIGVERATGPLAAALEDGDAEVRLRAAKALGALGGRPAILLLIRALAQPTRWSTIRIGDILAQMGVAAANELMAAFPGLTHAAQLTALDILGQIRTLESGPWLVDRLRDDSADVRARAAHALGAIGDQAAGPALIAALADPEWPVRAMAAKALGRIHVVEAVGPLATTLRDPQWWVRANSAEALRQVGEAGREALLGVLDDDDAYARHQAIAMLEESGVLDAEVARLSGPDGPERRAAMSFVQRVIRAGQVGRLEELSRAHAEPAVREALTGALAAEARR